MFRVMMISEEDLSCKETVLSGINHNSTGYEYGEALAQAISEYLENKIETTVLVYEDNRLIHKLEVIPKSAGVMITENGVDTMPLRRGIFSVSQEMLPEKYLVMVNPEYNNNKFYRMVDLGLGKWGAFYGRIGTKQGEGPFSSHISVPYEYPDYMYALKLKEKLLKGYRDMTDLHVKVGEELKKQRNSEFEAISDVKVADLIKRLMQYAQETVRRNYTMDAADVTEAMLERARNQLATLKEKAVEPVNAFNDALLELMHIIPRRIDGYGEFGVRRMMATTPRDYAKIIVCESELLDVMEGQVAIYEKNLDHKGTHPTILEAMGIEIYVARPNQREEVERMLDDSLKEKLTQVYRVINKKTQKRFDDYLATNGNSIKVKQFWHGSRNENWISILQKGLLLNPDAITTGKMFGNGIYFASSAKKSLGYTSANGAAWTDGSSDTAFLAIYATAYRKPYEVFSHDIRWYKYNYDRLKKEHPECSCVHAKAAQGMLRNDEIVFYREDQMTINYICEFRGVENPTAIKIPIWLKNRLSTSLL